MKTLLIYSSTEGHTARIVKFLKEHLMASQYRVDVAVASLEAPSPTDFDLVIIAAPIHAGQYANEIVEYVSRYSAQLNRIPSLFFSIGLTVTSKDPKTRETLHETTKSFLNATGWRPEKIEQIAGALLYTKYGFFKRMLMKSIMKKAGGDTDTKRDFVYTDWEGLKTSLQQFTDQFEMVEH
jgi:menaquinone-dependent protoporphyrinogen oxidase